MLTQAEADALIAMRKRFFKLRTISLPPGVDETHELIGDDKRERFLLDLWRGTMRLSKYRMQTRGRIIIVLVRLDIKGAPHTNPDGQILDGTHLHIYREGFDDKWAYPVNPEVFHDIDNAGTVFEDFCRFCHVEEIPPYQEVLF
jgi:hypothetical protein